MKALSYVVASILMLVITISLSGTAYLYMSGVFTGTIQGIEIADTYCSLGEVTLKIKNIGTAAITALDIEQTNPQDDFLTPSFQGTIEPGKTVQYKDTCEGEQSRKCTYRITPPAGKTTTSEATCSGRPESLVLSLHFDEEYGMEAKDSSGGGNDRTLQNIYPLDVIANNTSLEEPWYFVEEQDINHKIERPGNWKVSYNFAESDKMLAFQETDIVKDGDSASHMVFLFTGATFTGSMNINNCDSGNDRFEIDENEYLEGGTFQYPIRGPSSYVDQTFSFYNATGDYLSRRWAYSTDLNIDVGDGWRIKSYVWQPSSSDPYDPTVGGDIPYIPKGAKYACFMQYFIWHGGPNDMEAIFDKFFIYQWTAMPTDEQRISRASSGWVKGKYGSALSFDGVNDYVNASNDVSLDMTINDFTISAWVNIPSTDSCNNDPTNPCTIVGKGAHGDIGYKLQVTSAENLMLTIQNATDFNYATDTTALPVNSWNHVAVIIMRSTNQVKFYINDQLSSIQDLELSGSISNPSRVMHIGSSGTNGYRYFNGIIDEVRIYNKTMV